MGSKSILLVEDDPKDVELILEALSDHGLVESVTTVRDGVEALEYLRREGSFSDRSGCNPAVVFLDIKMPRMNGIETLRAIREDAKLRTIPVVMLTSSREVSDLMQSYSHGANAYVVKPVHYKDLADTVKNAGMFWAFINELPPESGD